jgi:hypothetical protein
MAYTSQDDLINSISTDGKYVRVDMNKLSHPTSAAVAGEWSCLFGSAGNPQAGVLTGGTNRSLQILCDQQPGAPYTGGIVTPDTKTILGGSFGSAAVTTAPGMMVLVDMLGYYRASDLTLTGAQATINSTTFTALTFATDDTILHAAYDIASFSRVRLTTATTLPAGLALATDYFTVRLSATQSDLYPTFADAVALTNKVAITGAGTGVHTVTVLLSRVTTGANVDVFSVVTTLFGAGTPTVALTYTDAAGNTGNVTPTGAALPTNKTTAAVGLVPYSGTGSGKYGPYFPRATGDTGVRSIESINQSATQTSGAVAYVLAKTIASIPIAAVGVMSERDFVNQLPSLPKIEDGACLAWLFYNGAATPANSGFYGHLDIGWS